MRNGKALLAVLVTAAGLLTAGCGQNAGGGSAAWQANDNSIYVAEDMSVESALVYTSEQFNDLYKQEELSAYVEQAIADYTAENPTAGDGQAPVALKSCSLEGRTGVLVFDYASPEDFVKFAQATGDNTHTVTALTVRKVADELAAGGLTDAASYRTPKDKTVDSGEVTKQSEYGVVTVEGAATIFTEGEIAYVSGGADEIELKDNHTAVTTEGKHYIIFK